MKNATASNQVEPLIRFESKGKVNGKKVFSTIFFIINLAIAGFCIARVIF